MSLKLFYQYRIKQEKQSMETNNKGESKEVEGR